MRLRPNDLPPMIVGEARNLCFKLGGAAGANSITGFAIESCPSELVFGVPSISGTNVTVRVTAALAGKFTLVPTATLSSGETLKGHVRLGVEDCAGR